MRECKFKTKHLKSNRFHSVRLRGGAGNADNSLIHKAIANAKSHDINLRADERTVGDGNCIFESVLKNLNHRNSFLENLDGTADLVGSGRESRICRVELRAQPNRVVRRMAPYEKFKSV